MSSVTVDGKIATLSLHDEGKIQIASWAVEETLKHHHGSRIMLNFPYFPAYFLSCQLSARMKLQEQRNMTKVLWILIITSMISVYQGRGMLLKIFHCISNRDGGYNALVKHFLRCSFINQLERGR